MKIYKLYTRIRNYIKEQFIKLKKAPIPLDTENNCTPKAGHQSKVKSIQKYKRNINIEKGIIEPYELTLILNRMQDDDKIHWLLITQFLILTGMRITEFLALDKRDVDLKGKLINVYKCYNVSAGNINPKTPASVREIFIQPELYKLCVDINYFIDQQDLNYANKAAPLFFPSKSGGYLNCFAYQRYLKNTSKHVLLRCISSHELRSSHSSILRAQGVSNDAIACRLGYEDRIITRNNNLPLSKKQKEQYNLQIANTNII